MIVVTPIKQNNSLIYFLDGAVGGPMIRVGLPPGRGHYGAGKTAKHLVVPMIATGGASKGQTVDRGTTWRQIGESYRKIKRPPKCEEHNYEYHN